jgi:hypothetical protein
MTSLVLQGQAASAANDQLSLAPSFRTLLGKSIAAVQAARSVAKRVKRETVGER